MASLKTDASSEDNEREVADALDNIATHFIDINQVDLNESSYDDKNDEPQEKFSYLAKVEDT